MTAGAASWEAFLASRFVGYLLPASASARLSEDEAHRFLRRLTAKQNALELLRTTAALAPHAERFTRFISLLLPDLLRSLPSRNTIVVRRWEGGYHGRLDVRKTIAEHARGSPATYVTSARRRDFALPENVLVRAVVDRLSSEIEVLLQAKVLAGSGWGAPYLAQLAVLRRVLGASRLADLEGEPIGSGHLAAARASRNPCHREAAWWWANLEESRTGDPERLARMVAVSALSPLEAAARFELAVVVKLLERLEACLCGDGGWRMELSLLLADREEVARFVGQDGVVLRVFYNQSVLPAGPADLAGQHYLGNQGRMRPDVTVTLERGGRRFRAHVIEVKHSSDAGYILGGLHEAMLYAHEYARELSGWPKAILVASSRVDGRPRTSDEVIAVDWERWVPENVLEAFAETEVKFEPRSSV